MILQTERLILRPWEESDATALFEYAKDARIGPVAGWPVHTSAEESREIIRDVLSAPETYAVCLKEDNRVIGCVGLMVGGRSNIGLPDDEGEIGYWIGAPFWGRGLIPEAAREIIRRAFCDLRLKTLWGGYFDGNGQSKRVMEKCGFVYHHTNRDAPWPRMHDVRTEHILCLPGDAWRDSLPVRALTQSETDAALALAWNVFTIYESPDYSAEGTEEFRKALHDADYLAGIAYYGAFDGGRLIGTVGIRPAQRHICFFFVDGRYHRLGIGTRLFRFVSEQFAGEAITLNASPYGLPFYKAVGFVPTDAEQTVNGIRFTPMRYC